MLHVYRIGGKLSLVFYIVMLYQLWHLCQYGGLRSHMLKLLVVLLGLVCTLVMWLIGRNVRKRRL